MQQNSLKRSLISLPTKPRIWLHAASAGEYEQLRPVLRRINREKHVEILTVFSSTIYDQICNSDEFDFLAYLPFDTRKNAREFVRSLSAKIWIISRHDLWFNHIYEAHKTGTKIAVINANLHKRSRRFFAPKITRATVEHIDKLFTMNSESASRWTNFCASDKIETIGDTRFDQILDRKRAFSGFSGFSLSNCSIFASLLTSDELVVFPVVAKLRRNFPHTNIILVPHEPDKKTLNRYVNFLRKNQIKFSFWSEKIDQNCLLVDQVGILADLYRYTRVAFIGGGFSSGVHSVIEPAIYENNICFGPNFDILEEAIELVNLGLVKVIKTSNELYSFFENQMSSRKNNAIAHFVEGKAGASESILEWIKENV